MRDEAREPIFRGIWVYVTPYRGADADPTVEGQRGDRVDPRRVLRPGVERATLEA
jgi:hypothetical protein